MRGMSATTGKAIQGDAHLTQSIGDILTTPLGTRVMRRDYGSLLAELIDQPFNARTVLRLYAATALAIQRWERRLKLTKVSIVPGATQGAFVLTLEGQRTDTPGPNAFTRLTIPLRAGSGPALSAA